MLDELNMQKLIHQSARALVWEECPCCLGSGWIEAALCRHCAGAGIIPHRGRVATDSHPTTPTDRN